MAVVNVAGSYEAASLGTSYVDDYVMHADSEVVFWEETGAAYVVEMNISGQGLQPVRARRQRRQGLLVPF